MSGKFRATWMLACIALLAGCGATPGKRAYEYMPDMARGDSLEEKWQPWFHSSNRDNSTWLLPQMGMGLKYPRNYSAFCGTSSTVVNRRVQW